MRVKSIWAYFMGLNKSFLNWMEVFNFRNMIKPIAINILMLVVITYSMHWVMSQKCSLFVQSIVLSIVWDDMLVDRYCLGFYWHSSTNIHSCARYTYQYNRQWSLRQLFWHRFRLHRREISRRHKNNLKFKKMY